MKETIEDFLKRGGTIQKIEPKPQEKDGPTVRSPNKKTEIKTLEEGELLYGAKRKATKCKLDVSHINRDLLPDNLKQVYDLIKAASTKHWGDDE